MAVDRLKNWESMVERGHLYLLDKIPHGDPDAGHALSSYTNSINKNRQSRQWNRTIKWVENLLFGLGHHYINDILLSRLGSDVTTGSVTGSSLSGSEDILRNIPRPTNDLLGRYIETNIALLTENRPIPRVTPLSDSVKDRKSAELSELTINYLWEELGMPEKHREIARLLLYTGVAWLETWYDPLQARYLTAPQTQEYPNTILGNGISVPVPREVPEIDPETGEAKLKEKVEWGDIVSNVVSGFEMHVPLEHYWNGDDMGWVMREKYVPIDSLRDKYLNPDVKSVVNTKKGYFTDSLDQTGAIVVHNFPLWWWERLIDMTEGPGTSLYTGVPEQWEGYNIVRYFDRKPNPTWPKGRTIITVGDKLLYDSPKDVGARAFDPRWPKRWHPYTRYRWEAQVGSIFGRSLVSKLLPKLKRVNAIDTTMIMWRRTVPIASWIVPRGTAPVEDFFQGGMAGAILEYDPRRTAGAEPKPIFPPSYPAAALQERETQLSEMEAIAGTENILRGERPSGVNCWVKGSFLTDSLGRAIPVEKINIGDRHMSLKGAGPIGLLHKNFHNGKVFTLKSWGNLPVTVTPNHKFPVLPKEALKYRKTGYRTKILPTEESIVKRTASELKTGDLLLSGFFRERTNDLKLNLLDYGGAARSNQKRNIHLLPPTVTITEDLLWAFGLYMADGHCTRGEVIWTLHEEETAIANRIKTIIETTFNITNIKIKPVNNKRSIRVHVNSSALSRIIHTLFKVGSNDKSIHEDIFNLKCSLLPLVAGWLDGDGDKDNNSIRGHSTCLNIISQMRSILLDEKIFSTVNKLKIYKLVVSGSDAKKLASFSTKYKSEDFHFSNQGRRGFWVGSYYASYIHKIKELDYNDYIYNVTMDERTGCDNSVNSIGLFTFQSAVMLDTLRKLALSSRSAILQAWDESLQEVGTTLVQETIKNIKKDERYKQRLALLAREKASKFVIDEFSGMNLSDNVQVHIDTASLALVSREAKQQRALELLQYSQGLNQLPPGLRAKILDELGWPDAMAPQGADIDRGRALIQYLKSKRFDLVIPMPEDDPYVIHEMLVDESKSQAFIDLDPEVQTNFFKIIDLYKQEIENIENSRLQFQQQAMGAAQGVPPGQG